MPIVKYVSWQKKEMALKTSSDIRKMNMSVVQNTPLPHIQLESLLEQLKLFRPDELRRLQNELNRSLLHNSQEEQALTNEELDFIERLF